MKHVAEGAISSLMKSVIIISINDFLLQQVVACYAVMLGSFAGFRQ